VAAPDGASSTTAGTSTSARSKATRASQNYPLPADLDLARYRSVSIWCARFHVSFGAAALTNG
jgi:hypothetical protein